MAALQTVQLLEALRMEGPVTVFKPKHERFYHVFFRHAGKQINRSTGEAGYAAAKEKAAQIWAEVVTRPQRQAEIEDLVAVTSELRELRALLKAGAAPATTSGPVTVPAARKKSLSTACEEFLAEKKKFVSFHQYDGLKARCPRLVSFCISRGIEYVQDVTPTICHEWIRSLGVAPHTENGYMGDISNFLNWCTKVPRQWLASNPISALPRHRTKRGIPEILTPTKAAELMAHVERELPEFASYYALCLFAGIRADKRDGELKRLADEVAQRGWAPFLNDRVIIIPKPKVGPPRQFPLKDNLRAWLAAYPKIATPTQWQHQCLIKKFALPYNVMRHTAISAFVTIGGSMAEAATYFGNSESMIRRHYLNLISKDEAESFYQIAPKLAAPQRTAA